MCVYVGIEVAPRKETTTQVWPRSNRDHINRSRTAPYGVLTDIGMRRTPRQADSGRYCSRLPLELKEVERRAREFPKGEGFGP